MTRPDQPSPSTAPGATAREPDPIVPVASDAPVVIEARGVSKKYELQRHRGILLKDAAKLAFGGAGEKEVFWALRDVSFEVRRGEVVGIVGSNGAGKSTLLSLVAKTAMPTRGTIRVDGRVSALLELGAGFHPDFTGRENVYINGSVMGLSRKQIDERIDEIIEFSELGRFIDEPVRNYSSGMLARLGFSVAAEVDPDILIVDEALSVGDQGFQEKSFNRIIDFQRRGCTIIFVTHSLSLVERICHRAILLSHGQVIAEGPAREICREYTERAAAHQLEPMISPYEKEPVPVWKRLLALATLLALVGFVAVTGAKFVLSREMPDQRPPVIDKFGRGAALSGSR
jgi:ABC-type polysaccharide/polyol phosphate transport system ATPase subunit